MTGSGTLMMLQLCAVNWAMTVRYFSMCVCCSMSVDKCVCVFG